MRDVEGWREGENARAQRRRARYLDGQKDFRSMSKDSTDVTLRLRLCTHHICDEFQSPNATLAGWAQSVEIRLAESLTTRRTSENVASVEGREKLHS